MNNQQYEDLSMITQPLYNSDKVNLFPLHNYLFSSGTYSLNNLISDQDLFDENIISVLDSYKANQEIYLKNQLDNKLNNQRDNRQCKNNEINEFILGDMNPNLPGNLLLLNSKIYNIYKTKGNKIYDVDCEFREDLSFIFSCDLFQLTTLIQELDFDNINPVNNKKDNISPFDTQDVWDSTNSYNPFVLLSTTIDNQFNLIFNFFDFYGYFYSFFEYRLPHSLMHFGEPILTYFDNVVNEIDIEELNKGTIIADYSNYLYCTYLQSCITSPLPLKTCHNFYKSTVSY